MSAGAAAAGAPHAPLGESERAPLIDVLRGFALLGVFMANFGGGVGAWNPALDLRVNELMNLFVHASFYPLFSFLFGLGFAVQFSRARARGLGAAHLYLRRMLALFLIGTAHAVLIWNGDILVGYAFLGLLLIPVHRLPARGLLLLGVVCLLWNLERPRINAALERSAPDEVPSWVAMDLARGHRVEQNAIVWSQLERARVEGNALESTRARMGSYLASVFANWSEYADQVVGELSLHHLSWWAGLGSGLMALAMISGMYVGRMGWLERRSPSRLGFACVAAAGAAMATASWAYRRLGFSWGVEWNSLDGLFENAGTTMLYVGALALIMTTARGAEGLRRIFAPAGRMALTNYLAQSVMATLVLLPYGLGLNNPQPGSTIKLACIVILFFTVQIPFSSWWLARFRYGPAEWVWRSLTYGALQPMRRGARDRGEPRREEEASDLGRMAVPPLVEAP